MATFADTVMRLVKREGRDFTLRQIAVMFVLSDRADDPEERANSAVANAIGARNASITRAIDRLGGFGLVERSENDRDRRRIVLSLTESGRRFVAMMREGG